MNNLARLWRTVRHLRPVQVYGRLWFRLARPRPDLSPAPPLREQRGAWAQPTRREQSLTAPARFRFLNEEGSLAENGWDDPAKAKLWRYNQHYFDDLNAEGAETRTEWHRTLIADWIAKNPPGPGSGWDPYPTSLRIVNWVKWAQAGNALPEQAIHSLAVQSRWLMRRLEWHLLGNHLFANAKALVFAGLFFEGREAEGWLDAGTAILSREIPEQILPDGGQFELSPMYHALAVEDMLDLVNIARAFDRDDLAVAWSERLPAMLDWLVTMQHPDGAPAFFNDTAIGIAPSNRELMGYAQRTGFQPPAGPDDLCHLPASGYARLSVGPAVLIADLARIGPDYLPGHAHADTLSFELSLDGQRVIVNSGTSVYGLGPERLRQRSTAAHSTVTVDDRNSSEVWSGFRVGRRARPFGVETRRDGASVIVRGAHDGYRHLPGAPVHQREWRLNTGGLTVLDTVQGKGHHLVEARFHLAPEFCARQAAENVVSVENEERDRVTSIFVDGGTVHIEPATWHPQFGSAVANQVIRVRADTDLPCLLRTCLQWSVL